MKLQGKIKFVPNQKTPFFQVLKKRIDEHFATNGISKNANAAMVLKSIVLLSCYIFPFVFLLASHPSFFVALGVWILMGVSLAGIGMSVMHDANHGAYSSSKWVNTMMGHTLNLLGGSVFNWKLQHNILHHTYTNIVPLDEDIQDRLVLRFSPHTQVKKYQKNQWFYAFFFYGLLSLYWVVAKDLVQLISFTKNGVNPHTKKETFWIFIKISAVKIVYLAVMFALPMLYFNFGFLELLGGFVLMHFIAGLILTVVFQLAHTVEGTAHPVANESGNIENDWAIHQLNTTVNFSKNNWFVTWYVGGLNYQIEHHLFPRICHIHYPEIAPIVKATAEEFGIEYMENKTFTDAVQSHINLLKKFGTTPAVAYDF